MADNARALLRLFSVSVCQRTGGFGTRSGGQARPDKECVADYTVGIVILVGPPSVQSFTVGAITIS